MTPFQRSSINKSVENPELVTKRLGIPIIAGEGYIAIAGEATFSYGGSANNINKKVTFTYQGNQAEAFVNFDQETYDDVLEKSESSSSSTPVVKLGVASVIEISKPQETASYTSQDVDS